MTHTDASSFDSTPAARRGTINPGFILEHDEMAAERYAFAHGRRPRGYGRWAFAVTFRGFVSGSNVTEMVHPEPATYTAARAAAARWARARGLVLCASSARVSVQS
jgi:hypothetical protein